MLAECSRLLTKRVFRPSREVVQQAAAWLASEQAAFVTGQVIHLNRGSIFGR
jgi:NAD(P)-dependent dehydrogenase (short-subunit alcohol dehydrogenase family)